MLGKDKSISELSNFIQNNLDYILGLEKRRNNQAKVFSDTENNDLSETKSEQSTNKVLFIFNDEADSESRERFLDFYTKVASVFDEVHILVLQSGNKTKNPVLRIAKNVWLYTANSREWWKLPFVGRDLVEEQLVFAGRFHPDLIIALDPFESAYLAIKLGDKYKKTVQLHVLEDYQGEDFLQKKHYNRWRKLLANHTIPKVQSVRVATCSIYDSLKNNFRCEDLDILPRYNAHQSLNEISEFNDIKSRYKSFDFMMLYVGNLNYDSGIFQVMEALRFSLLNSKVGLVILGDGVARHELEKKVEFFGIKEQVVFETKCGDTLSFLKSADALIVADTDYESEDLVLKSAMIGVPMIMTKTAIREDVFTDGESALFCEGNETEDLSYKLNLLIHNKPLQDHLREMSRNMVKVKFYDSDTYHEAYANNLRKNFRD